MKPTIKTTQELSDIDDLNEKVLEDAAHENKALQAPETIPGTANIIAWNETADAGSHRVAIKPAENDETIAEQLVDAGNDEAGLEQRLSANLNKPKGEQR
ncbi:MAG: hypothetical protein B7Z37_02420 [Verrucomicrobia bacterium 12-59-8]|nr:MAG: hypothetical protein B7Z37_02420 [Verrucomicrobia bacterium 12-59-8]